MMKNRPNIFDYATKELSQDAVVCWLLKCCHSDNDIYKNIGYDFVRFILGDECVSEKNIELEKNSPHAQYYHMDVYANIRVGEEIVPVIFEDKTDTFLHGSQETRYTEMVNGWKNDKKWTKELFDNDRLKWSENTRYVFFKTGYVFDWQRKEIERFKTELNAKVKIIYIDDILKFTAVHKDKDFLLADYHEYLLRKKSGLADSTEDRYNRYFRKIFGDNKSFLYNHQQWAARNIGEIEDQSKKSENKISYSIRTGRYKNGYAVVFQQYRNEKTLIGSCEEKKRLTERRYVITESAREMCKQIAQRLGVEINIEHNDKNRMPSQNNIFKLVIDKDNEDMVCSIFKEFIKEFNKAAKEKYNDKYIIC